MSNIDLVEEKSQFLRVKSLPWDFNSDAKPAILVGALKILMLKHKGIGLAANQVGIPYRAFVMGGPEKLWECFNPEIVDRFGQEEKKAEGCLSFPNLVLDINRFSTILVRYSTAAGDLVEEELTGNWARCFQHEFDHIDGVCFDQRVSKLALDIATRKRAKALKRNFK